MSRLPPDMNPSKGQTFLRTIKSLAVAGRGGLPGAIAYASSQNWSNEAQVVASLKAAVTAQGTGNPTLPSPAQTDFSDFIRAQTILGKLIGLRRVPSRTRYIAATSGSTSHWSGEAQPRPLSRLEFEGDILEPLAVTSMAVVALELLRSSAPSAESILSRDLSAAAVEAMDQAFIDPSNAGESGVKPAAITNGAGAPVIHSSGATLAAIDADLDLLIQALSDAGSDLSYAAFVMRPRTALKLAGLRGSGGALAFPGVGVKGGEVRGLPVVVSSSSPSSVGSPAEGGSITLLDAAQILIADDGGSALEVSEQASVQMEDAPGSGAQSLVSLWQAGAAALKITRFANWKRCRDGMVQVLDAVAY